MNHYWTQISSFGHFIYTVGDGTKRGTISDLNNLSTANCQKAASLAVGDPDAVLFIAGGNGSERSARPNRVPGSLTEARRMQLYIHNNLTRRIPILTDCDLEFRELTGCSPSENTPENSRNAVACLLLNVQLCKRISIVAEQLHLPRVIGTVRRKLADKSLLASTHMVGYPVSAEFDPDSCQGHLQSELAYMQWEWKARLHHVVASHVLQREFLLEWMSGRNYAHLHATSSSPRAHS